MGLRGERKPPTSVVERFKNKFTEFCVERNVKEVYKRLKPIP